MTAEGWLASEYKPLKAHNSDSRLAHTEFEQGDTPVAQTYNPEIKALIKMLLPSATEFIMPVRGIGDSQICGQSECLSGLRIHSG